MPREKEFDSVAACLFQRGALLPKEGVANDDEEPEAWTVTNNDNAGNTAVSCVFSPPDDTSIRLSPMYRKTPRTGPRWKPNVHFHADLHVTGPAATTTDQDKSDPAAAVAVKTQEGAPEPEDNKEESKETTTEKEPSTASTSNNSGSVFLQFQAIAREGIAVALSPQPKYTGGCTYEIFYGDRGNTQTLIERRSRINNDKIHVALPGRHCAEKQWTSYWIALLDGKVYAGIGKQPPQQCLGVLDDIAKQDQSSSTEEESTATTWYVGMGNSSMHRDGERPFINLYRNIRLASVPLSLQETLRGLDTTTLSIINVQEDEMDEETKALLKEYEQECEKAKARAAKFGLPYKEPPSFLPWSKVRRLQANPKDGFATGLDLQDPAEKAKQDARRKRFGLADMETTPVVVAGENVTVLLPVTQAWDNEKLVREQRIDPPQKLWKTVPESADENPSEAFSLQPAESKLLPEKIHLFAIDWAAFKQIRTNDLSAYFSMYSPTYVEWLGDLSCNIHFQDKFTASRALENLSQEIPTPPPPDLEGVDQDETVPDLGAMGWRLGKTLLRKTSDDRYGRRGTTARILLRVATSLDVLREKPSSKSKPPPGFSRNRVLGPGSDFSRGTKAKRSRSDRQKEETNTSQSGEPSLLSGGLKASRAGFTVEEMEAERAKKRAKPSEDPPPEAAGAVKEEES